MCGALGVWEVFVGDRGGNKAGNEGRKRQRGGGGEGGGVVMAKPEAGGCPEGCGAMDPAFSVDLVHARFVDVAWYMLDNFSC